MTQPYRSSPITRLIPQLFVWIILPLTALVLVVAFGSIQLHDQAMRDMASQQDLRTVRAVAATLNEQVKHREDALQALSASLLAGAAPEAIVSQSDYLSDLLDGGFAFYDRAGTLLAASSRYTLEPGSHAEVGALLTSLPLVTGAQPEIFPGTGPLNGEGHSPVFLVTRITSDREAVGVFTVEKMVQQAVGNTYSGIDTSLYLVNNNYQAIYQSGPEVVNTDMQNLAGFREALQGQSGVAYQPGPEGEHLVAFAALEPLGWGLVIDEPWQVLASPKLRSTQTAPLVLVPVLLLSIVALWFGTRQIIRPLRQLASRSANLAAGDYQSIQEPVGGIAEISNLQSALAAMALRVQSAQSSLRRYIAAITSAQEDERRRLARELHDDTLQAVIALNQRVQMARLNLNGHPAGKSLEEIQSLTERTVTNLRRLMHAMRPVYLEELGLGVALQVLTQETDQASGLHISFEKNGNEQRLSQETELAVYRMVQEALNNIVRHAKAAHAWVRLDFYPDLLKIEVRDDGQGFELADRLDGFAQAGHFGLLGLYERADLAGAAVEIKSAPGQGTRVGIQVPLGVTGA